MLTQTISGLCSMLSELVVAKQVCQVHLLHLLVTTDIHHVCLALDQIRVAKSAVSATSGLIQLAFFPLTLLLCQHAR